MRCRFAVRTAGGYFLAKNDSLDGGGFGIERSGTDVYAVVADDVNSGAVGAMVWRVE
jgi:hypothetical protein